VVGVAETFSIKAWERALSEIEKYLGSEHLRPDGSTARVHTKWAYMGADAPKELLSALESVVGSSAKIVLLCDPWTRAISNEVEKVLSDKGLRTYTYELEAGADGSPPSADDLRVEEFEGVLREQGSALAVAVGAGTINDIAKMASHRLGTPYFSYGTAASMNGYTSGIAALYSDGLKVTVPATPALGVFADPKVVAEAPLDLTLAGLGDLCSKPFATADARVAAIAVGDSPWSLPSVIVESVFEEVLKNAAGVGAGDPEAVTYLMEALWVSGISMVIAGSSAPASGGEHLWSHRLDMARHDRGLPPLAYHGTQVGVACGLVRPLFERVAYADMESVLEAFKGAGNDPDPSAPEFLTWLRGRHPDLGEQSLSAISREAARKYEPIEGARVRQGLVESWEAVRNELMKAHHHAGLVHEALTLAKAPTRPEDLGMAADEAARILHVCRDIRNRLTILDLAAALS